IYPYRKDSADHRLSRREALDRFGQEFDKALTLAHSRWRGRSDLIAFVDGVHGRLRGVHSSSAHLLPAYSRRPLASSKVWMASIFGARAMSEPTGGRTRSFKSAVTARPPTSAMICTCAPVGSTSATVPFSPLAAGPTDKCSGRIPTRMACPSEPASWGGRSILLLPLISAERRLPSALSRAGNRFIAGEPMNSATNTFAGRS